MRMTWVQRIREQGPGPRRVQIFKSVCLPVESAHSPFGHAVRGGVFRGQPAAVVSVLQPRSS